MTHLEKLASHYNDPDYDHSDLTMRGYAQRTWIAALAPLSAFPLMLWAVGGNLGPSDFIEVAALDTSIRVDLPYATEQNFTKKILYPVARCYLRREVAEALVEAHRSLEVHGLGLKIWDGYRPRSVQYAMWKASPSPGFVGDPRRGSKHNRGAAVDVTLWDLKTGEDLTMPTPYDEFSLKAHSSYDALPPEVVKRRQLLQKTMRAHGFSTIQSEWWHFDFCGWENFSLEDIPIEEFVRRDEAAKDTPIPDDPTKPDSSAPETKPDEVPKPNEVP